MWPKFYEYLDRLTARNISIVVATTRTTKFGLVLDFAILDRMGAPLYYRLNTDGMLRRSMAGFPVK